MNKTDISLIKTLIPISTNDTSCDTLILFYYKKLSTEILQYCNLTEMPEELNYFIIEKLASILRGKLPSSNTGNEEMVKQGLIKSISRGDTKIEYNTDAISSSSSVSVINSFLTSDEKTYLRNTYRKVRW